MLRNYIITALRNLVRNRLYAAINIVGLALGFAAALLIALYLREELSFDRFIPGHEDVYLMGRTIQPPDSAAFIAFTSDAKDAATLKTDFPEIQSIARLDTEEHSLRRGDVEATEGIAWADPQIFEVLPLPMLHGNPKSALQDADTVVLTRRMARKYFGRDDVVGETIEIDRTKVMRVTAVLDDLPTRTHLSIDILVSGSTAFSPFNKPDEGVTTYVRLRPKTSAAAVESRLPAWIDRQFPIASLGALPPSIKIEKASQVMSAWLMPIAAIHLTTKTNMPEAEFGLLKPPGSKPLLAALAVVGILILFIATANFVNLMTARAGRRAIEVGVRKSTGARRVDLVLQFLGESFLQVAVAFAAAVALVTLSIPTFNAFLDRQIAIEPWRDFSLPAIVLALALSITLLGGLYPAFVLSAFRPATVLKGGPTAATGSTLLRQLLVVLQFAIFIGLILSTTIIDRQTLFAMNDGFRLDTDQLLIIEAPCRDALRNQLAALGGVRGVACAGGTAVGKDSDGRFDVTLLADGRAVSTEVVGADAGLLELYGLHPLAGRFFDPQSVNSDEMVLNESAVHAYGYESPESAIGQRPRYSTKIGPLIIGVVEDFPIRSLHGAIGATTFQRQDSYKFTAVKLEKSQVAQALPQIESILKGTGAAQPAPYYFYNQYVQRLYVDLVRQGRAFTAFAGVAIFISTLGLFGLATFTAERRTKEIGIRKAMGASRAEIVRLLLWQFAKPVLWANVIAWPVAYLIMRRWLEGFAYHIDLEPWMFLAASALAILIAVFTVIGHALLVARAKPVAALRYE